MKKILLGTAGIVCGLALVFSVAAPAQAAALTSSQVQAIIGLLQSFGADQSVINNVSAVLGGNTSSGSQTCSTFADLTYGSFDTEPGGRVSQLQTWLGISSSTFGFGTYGPRTLALWKSRCGGGTTDNVNFSASPTYGVAPLTATFSANFGKNNTNAYSVDFGDGQTGSDFMIATTDCGLSGQCVVRRSGRISHTYTSSGTYTAQLRDVRRDCLSVGCDVVGTATITVLGYRQNPCDAWYPGCDSTSGAPSINGLDSPTSLNVGQTGTWTVHASAPSGTQLHYSVIWGDEGWGATTGSAQYAQSNVQTSATFSHTYQNAGTYTPTFTVSNDYGSVNTSASVVVSGTTVTPTFSASPTSGFAPLAVQFFAGNLGSNTSSYSVDFGDGSAHSAGSCSSSPGLGACIQGGLFFNHTYASAGTYTATLVQKSSCPFVGQGPCVQDQTPYQRTVGTATITVSGNTQTVSFSASPTSGFAPLGVSFTMGGIFSTDADKNYTVDFGDGVSMPIAVIGQRQCFAYPCESNIYGVSHTYNSAGTYTAKLMYQPPYTCPSGMYCTAMMPAPQVVGTVTITVMTGWL